MKNKKRIEFDSLGSKKIDINKLWGAQTQRSFENFKIGSEKIPVELIIALGQQKKAAAEANIELGVLNRKLGQKLVLKEHFLYPKKAKIKYYNKSYQSQVAKYHIDYQQNY